MPSLLVSSLLMTQSQEELSNDIAIHADDYYDSHLHHQILFLNYFINKFRQDSSHRSRELYAKSSRFGSPYSNEDVSDDATSKNDYPAASNADYSNDVGPHHHHVNEKPNCEEGDVHFLFSHKTFVFFQVSSALTGCIYNFYMV